MKYMKHRTFLVWLSIYLTLGALHGLETGQELLINSRDIKGGYSNSGTTHVICKDDSFLAMLTCATNMYRLKRNGFPWGLMSKQENRNQSESQQLDLTNTIKDPLDPVNYVCDAFERFLKCLKFHSIPNACLLTGDGEIFRIHTLFNFICYKEHRNIHLLDHLRCLQEKRVVDLMVFHLADKYGTSLIDIQAQGATNGFFRALDSNPLVVKIIVSPLAIYDLLNTGMICFPKRVISHHVKLIVSNRCGSQAADLVSSYYLYFREQFNNLLHDMAGINNICISSKKIPTNLTTGDGCRIRPETKHGQGRISLFKQFLEDKSPNTAMDTIYGHVVKNNIKGMSVAEFCNPVSAVWPFQACVLLSYYASDKAMFNILQYAHSMTLPYTDFPRASSTETFGSCWNLLQQICGANASYHEYSYHVSTGSRQIERMMDDLTCKWQDMLIGHYIAASEGRNIWPTAFNAANGPMFLSRAIYTLGDFQNSMSDLSFALDAGIKEIATKCSKSSAKRIRLFYQRLHYFLYNVLKLQHMISVKLYPHSAH